MCVESGIPVCESPLSDTPLSSDKECSPQTRMRKRFSKLNPGGIRQSSLTLIQTSLGAGFLTLPYAMHLCGLGLGLVLLFLDGLVVYIGIEIILRGAVRMDAHDTATLLSKCVGKWSGPALDLLLVLSLNGACVAYFILCGDLIPSILKDMETMNWISPPALSKSELRSMCILATAMVAAPLSVPKTLSALRYVSPIAIISVLCTSLVILFHAPALLKAHWEAPGYGEITWFKLDFNFFKAFSILVFAYHCHLNAVPVASELQKRADGPIARISGGVVTPLIVFYAAIAGGGYLSFFGQTHENILTNYSLSPAVTVCRVSLSFSIILAIPLHMTPIALSALNLIEKYRPFSGGNDLEDALLATEPKSPSSPSSSVNRAPPLFVLALKAVCLAGHVALALMVTSIADVMAFLGATTPTVTMFGIPLAVLYTVKFEDFSRWKVGFAVLLLGSAMVISIAGIFVMILQKAGVLAA